MSLRALPSQREINTGDRLLAVLCHLAPVVPLSLALSFALVWALTPRLAPADVVLERREDRVDVTVEGEPFTSYIFQGHAQPILFPIRVPGGETITRSWPMVPDVEGEAHDHVHHESLWFCHGSVNGIDFWARKHAAGEPTPRIEQVNLRVCQSGPQGLLEADNRWCAADGTVVCTDTRTLAFSGDAAAHTLDYQITLRADHGPVTLGDTKEGTMALRVRSALQPVDAYESTGAVGKIVNSSGLIDGAAWGKPARWVDYSAPIAGRTIGVAAFDHPANLRHPALWHAREYGLCAANPFGIHDFTGAPPGSGDYTIPAGGTLELRYRFVFHTLDAEGAGVEERWQQWAHTKSSGGPAPVIPAAPSPPKAPSR